MHDGGHGGEGHLHGDALRYLWEDSQASVWILKYNYASLHRISHNIDFQPLTAVVANILPEKDLVDLEETRVRPISGVDHVAVDLIVLYEVC